MEGKALEKLEKRIGKKIAMHRQKRKLTSEQLAYQFGISKGYLSDIENGKRLPSLQMLEKIAQALKVDIRELF